MVQDKRLVVLQDKAAKGNAVAQNEVISLFFQSLAFWLLDSNVLFLLCVHYTHA